MRQFPEERAIVGKIASAKDSKHRRHRRQGDDDPEDARDLRRRWIASVKPRPARFESRATSYYGRSVASRNVRASAADLSAISSWGRCPVAGYTISLEPEMARA